MPDLTLDEYKSISKEELSQMLREEAQKICGINSLEHNSREEVKNLYAFQRLKLKWCILGMDWLIGRVFIASADFINRSTEKSFRSAQGKDE